MRTPPPVLRHRTPAALYDAMPLLGARTLGRPAPDEDFTGYVARLHRGPTPEDAVTVAAFAFLPRDALAWGYDCVQSTIETLDEAHDTALLEDILTWMASPEPALRWRILSRALAAEHHSPLVHLGLAVGWSGGAVAPADPLPPPIWRMPDALNAALFSALAQSKAARRRAGLDRIVALAMPLFGRGSRWTREGAPGDRGGDRGGDPGGDDARRTLP
ncbi:MAG: DUF6931 family protein [Shimia sp.]